MGPTYFGTVLLALLSISKTNGQSFYEYEPQRVARIRNRHISSFNGGQFIPFEARLQQVTNSPKEHPDNNYRAQATSHYRNIYRNRNYFVQSTDHENLNSNSRVTSPTFRADPKYESTTTKSPSTQLHRTVTAPVDNGFVDGHYNYNREPNTRVQNKYIRHQPKSNNDPRPTQAQFNQFDTSSDVPIHFGASTAPVQYIRSSPDTNIPSAIQEAGSKANDVRTYSKHRSKTMPSLDGRLRPQCAEKVEYCETYDKYPGRFINEVLRKTYTAESFQQVFGESTDNSSKITDVTAIILQRTGLNSGAPIEETPLCSSVEHTIYPKVAKNKEDKWMFVVNDEEYIQGVRIEKCLDEGTSCFFGDSVPSGYQTACRQKYIYKKLLALNSDGKTSTDSFRLPSCCVCFVKTASVSDRLLSVSPSTKPQSPAKRGPSKGTTSYPTSQSKTTQSAEEDGIEFQADQGAQSQTIQTTAATTTTSSN